MTTSRALPVLERTHPTSTAESLGQVRGWLETMTSSGPHLGIDWSAYQTVLEWSARECVHT